MVIPVALLATSLYAPPSFEGLGSLPGGDWFYSSPTGVSLDGSVVVGESEGANGTEAFRWSAATGMQGLGDLAGGDFYSIAFAVSPDGQAVTGWGTTAAGREAFLWKAGGGMQGLGDVAGGNGFTAGRGVNDGGTIVIGSARNPSGWQTMRWTATGGMYSMGDLIGDNNTVVMAVSPDCVHYVGFGAGPQGTEAYRGSVTGVKQRLGSLLAFPFSSNAYGLSPDGSIVVGSSSVALGREAFIWTEATGMLSLGDLPGGRVDSSAEAVSADGGVIVGYGTTAEDIRAVMWNRERAILDLNEYLPSLGIVLGGWILETANAVTPDGSVIVGSGINPEGEMEGWIARIGSQISPYDRIWAGATAHPDGWRDSDWYGWFHAGAYPLLWHAEHGWQACFGDSDQSVFLHDLGLGAWLWTARDHYPLLYRMGGQPGWLHYARGGAPGQRQFYDYSAGAWVREGD